MSTNNAHVAVIGGGCAGLSTAAALLDRGIQVTVFEASSQLGGRARTVAVENNNLLHLLDNGQHILLGAYRETLALLSKIGIDENLAFLRVPLQMSMHSISGLSEFSLKPAQYLPVPLNLLAGFLCCNGLSLSERIVAIKLMATLKKDQYIIAIDTPLERFLIDQQQSTKLIEVLWEPLCLAALNTPISIASTRIFLNVLRDSFSNDKKSSDFLLPRLDLSKIIAQPLSHYIHTKGGNIALNSRIRKLEVDANGFSLTTRNNKSFFSHVVIAVAPKNIDKLLQPLPKLQYLLDQVETYGYQPIYTIYLQYPPETILPRIMTGLTRSITQWVFDRGQLCGELGLISVVVSANGSHQQLTQDELALEIAKELDQVFPDLPQPLWYKVIAEKRATFSCVPNLARPTNKTMQSGLYLAGDYTYADYPATIEGAIRSGAKCAELIANS
ncbi:15-cis-phytoene desaturase [mine drainage metagenome]|uniref:15-cis-phytoene desaturase n=1 Tax=mine drainage metagenome TaxID=410659 RepID=A0A1J5SWW4_9ZZZZ